ncbi:MAG TPA: YraN family protein, partial [Polyangiales bacterium]|nr:YraN family protein [Polyangiales bacterium]
ARNLHVGRDELDLVARQGPLVVIVEVRTRGAGAFTSAFGSISAGKRLRLRRAGARLWDRELRYDASIERLRFDAASVQFVDGTPHIEYAVAAF